MESFSDMLDSLATLEPPVKRRRTCSPSTASSNFYAVVPEPTPTVEGSGCGCHPGAGSDQLPVDDMDWEDDEFDPFLDDWHVEWDRYEDGLWWTMRGRFWTSTHGYSWWRW